MAIIEISRGTEACGLLAAALSDPETYMIRIEPRAEGIAVKVNEGMWSATLNASIRPTAGDTRALEADLLEVGCVIVDKAGTRRTIVGISRVLPLSSRQPEVIVVNFGQGRTSRYMPTDAVEVAYQIHGRIG